MRRLMSMTVAAGMLAATWVALIAAPALAHEEREVGSYTLAVGFGDEPAYAGFENSVQMFLHDGNDRPVTDLGPTLQVEVEFGDQTMPPMTMEPNFEIGESGIPGDYRAFFIPTRPGDYTFHLTGEIKGQAVDESFTSSPTTFASVQEPSSVQFPAKDPSTGELAQRLDRQLPRVQRSAEAAVRAARDDASSARTLGLVGIALGTLGLLVAAAAFLRSTRLRGAEGPQRAGSAPVPMAAEPPAGAIKGGS